LGGKAKIVRRISKSMGGKRKWERGRGMRMKENK